MFGLISKVFANFSVQTFYGIEERVPIENTNSKVFQALLNLGKLILPIILFFIGVFVAFNKKITKKKKVIIITSLVTVSIFGILLMEYFANIL